MFAKCVVFLQENKKMPTIKIIDGIKINMYFNDHNPPHFHSEIDEKEELIKIENLETLKGAIPKIKRKKVIAWASLNQLFLTQKWNEFNPK